MLMVYPIATGGRPFCSLTWTSIFLLANVKVMLAEEAAGATGEPGYKWAALTITTLGMLMATVDASIMLIALPDIFRGIHLDPLQPGDSFYLLWMILSFLVVTSVLVVSLGRLGDMYGRVPIYNLGFALFTFFSLMLTVTWMSGRAAGLWLIIVRVFQGVGAAFLIANSAAILTDAFPDNQRGFALGINQAAGISGTFIGLVLGGVLAPINWRLIFLVSVPIGLFGTIWGYVQLREVSHGDRARVDWAGNITFALGLVLVMVAITYGIQPYGRHTMGWASPVVLVCLVSGVLLVAAFAVIETRVAEPMFRLPLFRIRAFTGGVLASFLAAVGRGGLMFMLIIWLQGIWLPLHGYDFVSTPLWAGIYMLPLTAGFLIAGPLSGSLTDHFGARPFATGGMVGSALTFVLLELLPINFPYWVFGMLLPPGHAAVVTGRSFFPSLISGPFRQGLHAAFDSAIVACLVAAAASWTRGTRYVHSDELPPAGPEVLAGPAVALTAERGS